MQWQVSRLESVDCGACALHGGARQYLVHLDGKEEWVDEDTVPERALEAFQRVRMLDASDTEHDDDDSTVTIAIAVTMTNVFCVAHE